MRTYSVPRRFGLGTLLVATLAFSGLSALFRWLEWPVGVVLGIMAFIGVVSAAQFAFEKRPRWASAGAGAICFLLVTIASMALDGGFPFDPVAYILTTISAAVSGAIAGYVTGAMIGSVFMMMAAADRLFAKRPNDQAS